VGIGFGGVIVLMILVAVACYCYRRSKAVQNLEQSKMKGVHELSQQGIMTTEQPIGQEQINLSHPAYNPGQSTYLIGEKPPSYAQFPQAYAPSLKNYSQPILQPTLSNNYGLRM
jgi:hypothetical protein